MTFLIPSYVLLITATLFAGPRQGQPTPATPQPPPNAEKLGPNLFRIGQVRVNTSTREVSVPGKVNQVTVIEFAANAAGGMKAYESALTLDTDAITFNTALVLVGLDRKNAKIAREHFDPAAVSGDPVEVSAEWNAGGRTERVPLDRLIVDKATGQPVAGNSWVYTGSTFWAVGRYAATVEGVLIGFAHTPNSIIESARGIGLSKYGTIVLNPGLGLAAGTPVTVTVRALGPSKP
jgi:hypothetical protein